MSRRRRMNPVLASIIIGNMLVVIFNLCGMSFMLLTDILWAPPWQAYAIGMPLLWLAVYWLIKWAEAHEKV